MSAKNKHSTPYKALHKEAFAPEDQSLGAIAYRELEDYAETSHRLYLRLIRVGMVIFYSLPIVLIIFMKMTGADISVTLLIWIICMFALAFFLIFLSYSDAKLKERVHKVHLQVPDDLSLLSQRTLLMKELNGEHPLQELRVKAEKALEHEHVHDASDNNAEASVNDMVREEAAR